MNSLRLFNFPFFDNSIRHVFILNSFIMPIQVKPLETVETKR